MQNFTRPNVTIFHKPGNNNEAEDLSVKISRLSQANHLVLQSLYGARMCDYKHNVAIEGEKAIIFCLNDANSRDRVFSFVGRLLPEGCTIAVGTRKIDGQLCMTLTVDKMQLDEALKKTLSDSTMLENYLSLCIECIRPDYFAEVTPKMKEQNFDAKPVRISVSKERSYIAIYTATKIEHHYEVRDLGKILVDSLERNNLPDACLKEEHSTPDQAVFSIETKDLLQRFRNLPLYIRNAERAKTSLAR